MFKKWYDRKMDVGFFNFKRGDKESKSATIMQYVEIYSGPEYEVFFKYTFIMKYVAISLVYGYALPIVFPITLVALIN